MAMTATLERIEVNGTPAGVEDLRALAQTNYGHFSAMQVVDGCVRGLDLHLERIERATRELFGTTIDRERVRACLRHAVAGSDEPLAVRVNVFAHALNRNRPAEPVDADILVMTARPSRPAPAPLRVKSFRYTRDLPQTKHVGTFPLFHYRRLAQQAGFDDALFVDADGCVSEGSIWNVGFFDGAGVVWPDAPQLTGVSMQLLQAGLARNGLRSSVERIGIDDVGRFRAAFFTNSSTPVQAIASIDAVGLAPDPALIAALTTSYEINPLQRI
jgi:branched-subunit amino acid aminotransferase/4-amino-4-deoxychorismate lyase